MPKTYRLRDEASEALNDKRIQMIIKAHEDIKESELLGVLVWKYLEKITIKEIYEYREKVLDKI